jgi:pSer/pThr/pTyr-binding forkhead associated (FHA) protein
MAPTEETGKGTEGQKGAAEPSASLQRVVLEVVFGLERGKRFALTSERAVLGRGSEADLVLDDPSVSRRHVSVVLEGDGVLVEDLGSENGLLVMGEKVASARVGPGGSFEIGSSVIACRTAGGQASPLEPDRMSDTQKLAILKDGRGVPAAEEAGSPTAPGMGGHVERPMPRSVKPSGRVARLVSWVMVATVVVGGLLLMMQLLDGMQGFRIEGFSRQERDGESGEGSSGGAAGASGPSYPETIPDDPRGVLPGASQVSSPPDVAVQMYREALALESDGKLAEAVVLLEEVRSRYPEFVPPGGTPVLETVELLQKAIVYAKVVKSARESLDRGSMSKEQLQSIVMELDGIPTTDGRFGQEATLLAEKARSQIKQLNFGLMDGQTADVVEQPAGGPADVKPAAEPVGSPEKPSGEEKPEPKGESSAKDVRPAAPIDVLSPAAELLGSGRYAEARRVLDEAVASGADAGQIQKVKTLFSLKFSSIMKAAEAVDDPEEGIRLLDGALALSARGSDQEKEALQLKSALLSAAGK